VRGSFSGESLLWRFPDALGAQPTEKLTQNEPKKQNDPIASLALTSISTPVSQQWARR